MNPVILPLIKNLSPQNVADMICTVQSMTATSTDVFKLTMVKPRTPFIERVPNEGDKRHEFSRGWQVYYGNEWIPEAVWWKVKIAGF